MPATIASAPFRLSNAAGLSIELNANGSLRRIELGAITVNLFPGNEMEGGPANLYLRRRTDGRFVPLLGPSSPTRFEPPSSHAAIGAGCWQDVRYQLELRLADRDPIWFWHVYIVNASERAQDLDLIHTQDIGLSVYAALRMNEYYVSQYIDHTPLAHAERGAVIASRQNVAVAGRHPWCALGSLRKAVSFTTDALQFHGLATREGGEPVGLTYGLSGRRLQHEHSLVALQDAPLELAGGERATGGFFGVLAEDHPAATRAADLESIERALSLPEARARDLPVVMPYAAQLPPRGASLFVTAARLQALDLSLEEQHALFGTERRHEEVDAHGRHLSFFCGAQTHVVLRAKELRVLRPHGHMLRTGTHSTPDERSLTSTVWMNGVFNSMLTQGHVSSNRFLSTQRSYLSLFRSQGQRVFVESNGEWLLLDVPSAFEMRPEGARWIYRHAEGLIEAGVAVQNDSHALRLELKVSIGPPTRFLIVHHVALNGEDDPSQAAIRWAQRGNGLFAAPHPQSELGRRFPEGGFMLDIAANTAIERIGGDELLFPGGRSRGEPYVCVLTAPTTRAALTILGRLIEGGKDVPPMRCSTDEPAIANASFSLRPERPAARYLERLADMVPWFAHDAWIHYLAPRGLEQFTGGAWGTRDVTQGPVELLLAQGRTAPVRDLLLRVMRAQHASGDWPQWFGFFERDRAVRAADSHGDIVFWPVLALAQYLIASGDATILDEPVAFYEGEPASVWQHVERALALIERRVIAGTTLAAYGNGDWNDALQPVDPSMRDHLCSAWTVTLHHQMLTTLARALRAVRRNAAAAVYERWAQAVRRDFQRLLIVDDVLAGYALFDGNEMRLLLHPRDAISGVRYSSLAMIHAVLENLFTPEQAQAHLRLMEEHLLGPDGMRLFDRPMPYHGGPQRLFQRAESAAYFGREIGLMYMHAHLRYAQALAHVGEAQRFFAALCQANPIGIREHIPQATLRQANCYYSSSDAAFEDRYRASDEYHRIRLGTVGLDGGWRIYSSGAGIAIGLVFRRLLGMNLEWDALSLDPVIPASLDGLHVEMELFGQPLEVEYAVGVAGCGVRWIELNGRTLAFGREDNPYRTGAARVSLGDLRALLNARRNLLRVALG